jgi:hypothetical protein
MEAIVGNLSLLFFFKTLVMKESCLLFFFKSRLFLSYKQEALTKNSHAL